MRLGSAACNTPFSQRVFSSIDENGLFAQAGVAVGDRIMQICGEECTAASLVELLQEVEAVGSGSFEIAVIRV